jgi:uncharacterized cupredoxin-like copper-binding protein
MPVPIRRLTVVATAIVVTVALAACGSSGSSSTKSTAAATPPPAPATTTPASGGSSSGSTSVVKLSADPNKLAFDTTKLKAKAGTVTIDMMNPSGGSAPHAIAIEGNGVDKDGKTVQPGGTSSVTVKLKPGKYSFYCPVPGHEAAGMKGTLTVS